MRILGISAFYHDSAAALVVDGHIAAAAQEERFTRKKQDASFPRNAIEYCLSVAGGLDKIDYVAFYDKPLAKFDRVLETFLAYAPLGFGAFREAIPVWLKEKLHIRRQVAAELGRSRRLEGNRQAMSEKRQGVRWLDPRKLRPLSGPVDLRGLRQGYCTTSSCTVAKCRFGNCCWYWRGESSINIKTFAGCQLRRNRPQPTDA